MSELKSGKEIAAEERARAKARWEAANPGKNYDTDFKIWEFDKSLFRKEALENLEHLDEDALADYHNKFHQNETQEPAEVPEEVVLQGSSQVGEHITLKGEEYVVIDSGSVTIDTGEEFVDGGYETIARHVDAPKIPIWIVTIQDTEHQRHVFEVPAETGQEAEHKAFEQSGLMYMASIASQKKRGGLRPGSGRTPRPSEYHQTSVDIREDLYEFLGSLPGTVQAKIEAALLLLKEQSNGKK